MSASLMSARYLLGDWGTTHLRLYLMERDRVADVREAVGIGALTGPPAEALKSTVDRWLGVEPIDVVLCGMASSRNGLCELPYLKAPANVAFWAQQAHGMQLGSLNILLATGMQCGTDAQGFDVMRGEEAQIFGAIQLEAALGHGSHCFVLPGTHSKWAEVEHGSVLRFRTALTGELYALLREHSTLLRAGTDISNEAEFDQGFTDGTERSARISEGLLAAIFQTRTAQLLEGRSAAWASGFLSGLLIGYEVATMSAAFSGPGAVTLIGQTRLASLYQRIFGARGISTRMLDGATCVLAGLSLLRELHTSPTSRAI